MYDRGIAAIRVPPTSLMFKCRSYPRSDQLLTLDEARQPPIPKIVCLLLKPKINSLWFSGTAKQPVVLNSQAFIDAYQINPGSSGVRGHLRFKDRCLPCATNTLRNTRQGRRVAQAALELCVSLERRDFVIFISSMSLNAELVACRISTPWKSRRRKRRFGRLIDLTCLPLSIRQSSNFLHVLGDALRQLYHQFAQCSVFLNLAFNAFAIGL